jgi:S-DNA-T family DNA segregation ATPase FtsK/SpoIIIE
MFVWSSNVVLPLSVLFAVMSCLGLWRVLRPASFAACVTWQVRSARRRRRVYRKRWAATLAATGLASRSDQVWHTPPLVAIRSTSSVDRVTVQLMIGQVRDDYAAVADRLAQAFGARDCRVRADPRRSNRLVLWFLVSDPLQAKIAPFEPADPPTLTALPVGVREDGLPYRLRLLGTHLLLVGATSAGKSSVIWAILHALAPGISSGLAAVWVIDPKGGMELAAGQRLFARFCHGDTDDQSGSPELAYAVLLEDAVAVMRQRQATLRGVTRLHAPTPAEPLLLLVVDELAALTSYVNDRDAKRRISAALSLLLSQGRAVGVTVVAALQDPRKEVLPARDLFPTRIGLRMTDRDQVDMVLGAGARLRGARCDQILESLPGVGYVGIDGVAEPVRVRFAHLTDTHIEQMVERYESSTIGVPSGIEPVSATAGGEPNAV